MMKRIFFALAFLPLALMAAYDYSNITDLWPSLEQIPHYDSNQVGIQPNMKNNADYRPGMHGMPYLRWYSKPSGSSTSRPCIILISGGAYNSLSDFSQGFYGDWQKKLTAAGIQCVDLFYRTPRSVDPLPIYQAAWDDGQRAVRVVRSMATERGIDPNKIGVISMSAGSHLATLLATSSLTPAYSRVDEIDDISCQINVALANAIAYGMSDGLTGMNTNGGNGATLDTIFKFDDQTCPMCMTQGGNDEYSPISSSMVWRRLREKGVATELHIYPDKGHSAYGLDRHIEFLRKLGWIPSETVVSPATRWPDDSACAGVSNETYTAGALTWYHPAVHKTASVQILLAGPAAASQEVSDAIVSARRYLNATGITVVTAQIRSGSEVADAQAAVAAVRADAAKYGLNADYIGLMGYRADAATAVAAATTTVTDSKVRWVAAISPTTGTSDAPLASITSDTPPTLFIHEDVNTTDSPVGSVASWERQRELNDQGAVHTLAGEDADFISAAAAPGTAAYTYLDRVRDFLSDKNDLAAWVEPEPEDDPDPVEPDPEIEIATLPWFDVQFLNSAFVAGADWIAQSTDPAGGVFAAATGVESELVKSTDEAHVSFVEDKEGVISYTPSASPSGAGTNLVVNGRAMVESMQALPASDATAKAGICFVGGYPYGYANGIWTKIGTTRLTEGAWVDYEIELDFTSDSAPSVRYTISGSVGEWLPLASGTASIQRARFLSGSFGDFKGEYNYVVEEPETPVEADPDTSWMAGSFGVSFHWTAKVVSNNGTLTWAQAVNNFNVKNFADSVESFGAQHVIFTTAHAWQQLPCPCVALDNLITGRTTERDLLKDIIDELTNRNIRVVFYYNHSCNHNEDQAWDVASGYDNITDAQSMTNFADNICAIVRELSLRYGDGVSAWWFDSATSVDDSQPWPNNKTANNVAGLTFPWDNLFAAARAGNPHAAVAVNWDVHAVDQHGLATDYLSGETEKIDAYGNFFPFAPEGLQDHIWTRMDSSDWFWTGNEVSTYGSRFSAEQLAWWKASHRAAGRMATLNLVIDEAGNINPVVAQQLVNAKTLGKVWVQGRYDPTAWQAAPSSSNLVLNIAGECVGDRSQYTDGYHRTPMTVLTDATVPNSEIVAGANLTNGEKAQIFEALEGNVFTWNLAQASDVYGFNLYSRSSRSQYNGATDGGNDAIVVTKIEVQQNGSSEWTDINAPALAFGKSDGISGGALAAKLVDGTGASLATGVTAIRFTQGACENGASLLVEAEVLGCATPPPYELGWTAGPMSATGDTLDTRGDLVYAFCRQQSAGWNTSSLTVNDIGFTGIWYTQHENVKIGGESLTTYFEFSPDLNNCSEGLGDENVTGDYGLFLKNGWWYSGSGNVTCTLKRLTAGKTYLVQFVTHWNSGTGRSFWPTDDTTKIAYTKSTDCAYGSYLTAVFTATDVTQTFEFAHTGNEFVVNGFQVRELAGGEEPVDPPVPEPPPVYALTIPAKAGLALDSVKTNSIPVEAVNSVYSIVSNTEVTVTFSAASGYELDGNDGVVVKTIVSDYSFVDSDYPAVKEQGGGEDPDDPPSGGDDVELGWTAGPMSATGDTIDTRGKLVYAFCQDGTSTGANMVTHEVNGVIYYGAYTIANTSNKLAGKNVSDYFTAQLNSTYGSCGDEGVTDVDCRQLLTNCFWDNKGEGTTFDLTLKQLESGKAYLVQITSHWSGQSTKKMYAPDSEDVYLQLGGDGWTYGGYLTGIFTANGTEETFAIKCVGGTGMINSIQVREVTLGGGEDPEEPQSGELVNGRANMQGWAMKRISTTAKGASETGFGWSAGDNPSGKSYTGAAEQCESVMTFTDAQVVNTIQLFAPKTENNAIPQVVNQMPSAFKIYGSNDGSVWTELLSVTGESDWLSMECRYYTFNNTTAYTQYKLAVESTVSGGAAKLGVYNYFLAVQPDPTTPWTFANGTLTRGDQQFTNVANDENKIYLRYSDNASNESLYDLDFTAGIVDGSGNPIDLPFKINGITGNKTITRVVGSPETLTFMGAEQGLQGIWYLNEVDFGTTLASAGIRTFKESYSLQHIHETDWTIPALLEETFTSCYNLSGDLVFHVLTNKAVFSGSRITSVSFPDITYFGNGNDWMAAFGLCPRLTNVVFGANLDTVNCGQFLGKIVGPTAVRWNSAPPTFAKGETSIFSDKADFTVTNYLPNDYETEWTAYAESKGSNFTLPDGDTPGIWSSGKKAYVRWWEGSEEPEEPEGDPVYTLTIPEKTGLVVDSVKTNGFEVAAVGGVYSIVSNTEVTITFAAAGGYELTGGATYVFTIDGNKTLADNEYPAVQEKPVPTGMIWYVSPTGAGLKDGTSPENALAWTGLATDKTPTFLAKGDTLKLLDGEYSVRTMRMTDAERDEITIEGNPEHPENVVISGAGIQYYFKCAGDFTVQGIKFTGSNAPSGILQVYDSTPCLTVRNCIFTDSASASRAVIVLKSGMSAVIEDCVVSNWSSDYGAFGCDNNCTTDADLTVRRCTFTNCTAQMSAAVRKAKVLADCVFDDCSSTANNGGALYRFLDGALITNCVFRNCRAENGKFGGVMSVADHAVTIVDSEFIGCGAAMGGAIYSDGCAVTCRNCLFASNYVASAGTMGGSALRVKAAATIDNCTFVDNLGAGSGTTHAPVYNSTEPVIRNCIFWNNKDNASGMSRASNYDSSTVSCAADLTLGGTDSIVLTASPFVGGADFSLTPLVGGHVNPCINSGSTLDWIAADTLDLAGNARVFADKVDLGAYEYGDAVESVYTLTIPAKEGLTVASVTTNGEEVVGVDGVYSVYPNAEVTITFAAAGGYELTGSGTVVLTVEENTTLADGQFPAVREHVALYVSSTAVTGEGDGSYANPYTMSEAWSEVKAGETIQLLDGTYVEETVRGDNSIFTVGSKDNITFQGNIEHPENVVIDFNGATSRGFYSNGHPFAIRGITFQNKQTSGAPGVVYMTGTIDGTALVENCCFSNVTTTATSGDGRMGTILRCDATGDVVVRNCEIKDCNCYVWGVMYMTKGNLTLSGCSVTNCHTKTGNGCLVGVNGGGDVLIEDSDFKDVGCELGTGTDKDNSSGILHVNSGSSASVTVRRCRFWQDPDCGSRLGAFSAVSVATKWTFEDCEFYDFKAGGGWAGLFYLSAAADLSLSGCVISNCCSTGSGGVIGVNASSAKVVLNDCTVSDCRITNTKAEDGNSGGLLYVAGGKSGIVFAMTNCVCSCEGGNSYNGGQMFIGTSGCSVSIDRCAFTGCAARNAGGVLFSRATSGEIIIRNTLFDGCAANNAGGSCIYTTGTSDVKIENCTFVGNTSTATGAKCAPLYQASANSPHAVKNCIFWNNKDNSGAGTSRVTYDTEKTSFENCVADVSGLTGVTQISASPFVDAENGDYTLAPLVGDVANPCIDAGVTLDWMTEALDLAGNLRVYGDTPDLGAYEANSEPPPVCELTIPTKEGLDVVSVMVNGVVIEPVGGVYSIVSNSEVTITFAAASGYELTGGNTAVFTIESDTTLGDNQYPAVQPIPPPDYWVFDSAAKTLTWGANVISNVTVSGKNLTIGNNQANPLAVDLDFSKTIDGDYQLVKISGTAFLNNSAVTRFIAPASLKTIEWNAFGPCANLATVELNEGLTALGDQAFYSCANLTTIGHLPSTLTSCGGNAFQNCSSLTGDLVWPAGLATFNIRLTNAKITSMDLSAATTLSGNGAGPFGGCSMLTNVIIGAGIDSVSAGNVLGDMGNGPTVHVWWQGVPTTIADYIFRNTTNYRIVNHLDIAQKADWEAFAANQSVYDFEFPDDLGEQGVWKRANLDVTVWNSYPQTIEWFGELSNSASVTPAVMSASVEFFVSNIGDAESADILFASAESGNELPEASVLFTGVVTGESKTSSITDLEPGTTYDYKVIYRDSSSEETLWEKTGTFTTLTPTAPAGDFVISTVTYRSIAFDATVTDFGVGSTDAVLTMEVSTTDDFATIAGSASVTVDETGTCPLAVSGLASETLYYCRLVISNTWDLETVSPVRSQRTKVVFAEDKFAKKVDMTLAGYAGTSTITDLPVLVRLSEGTPSGFSYADCPASSIRFTDADGNLLPHEVDTWNPEGESLVWVKVPTVSGTDTAISMYYGGAGMKQDRLPESEVWSNYAAVWHLNESGDDGVTTPVVVENSSAFGSALDGEAYGGTTATNGYIGGARHIFSGTGGMGGIWAPGDLDCTRFGGQLTLSAWLIHDAGTVSWDHIFYKRATSGDTEKYGGLAIELNNGNLSADVRGGNGTSFSSGTIVSKTKWTYVSYVYDNTTCAVYSDGVLKKTGTVGAVTDNDLRWTFGNSTVGDYGKTGNYPWRGSMDEIRLSGIVQTADYAAAEYAAMTNGFLSVGVVESTTGSAWTALVNEPGSVTLLGETSSDLENGPFTFKFASAVSGQPLGEWTTVADNLAAGAKLSQAASGFEVGVTYDYALICVDKDGTELAREEGSFMPAPAMPEFSSGTVWISGLEQAKFSSQFDVTSEKSASVIDVQVVPGTVMAEVSANETTYKDNGYTNPYTGRAYYFSQKNSTFAYYGWMWLEAGDTVNFAKNFDDAGFVKIGDTEVLKDSTYNSYPVGSYTAETTGWYRVDLRVGDGSGGKGPGGGAVGKSIGLGYNINGTATQAAEGWSPIRDDGNDAMFLRTVDPSIHPMTMGVTEVVRTGDDVTLWAAFKDVPGAAELRAYCDSEDHGDSPSEWQGYVKVADIAAGDTALAKYTAVGAGPNQFIRFALVVLGTETVQGRYLFSDPYEFAQDRPVFDPDSLLVTPRPSTATVNIELEGLGIGATYAKVYFAYGADAETLDEPVLVKADAVAGETLSVALADLTYETTYSFCFYATNDVNTEVGASFRGEFTTLPSEELAFRDAKILAGTKSAEASVFMKDVGEEADAVSALVTLAWGEDADHLCDPVVIATAAEKDEKLTYVIDGLAENTRYYYVFTATNNLGATATFAGGFMTPDPTIARSAHDFYPTNTTDNVLVPDGFAVTYFAEDVRSPYHVIPEDNCTFVYTSTVTTAGQEYKFFSEADFEANATARIGETYYLFLSDAVDAAESGDTIELLKDNNFVAKQMKIAFPLVINGNGHTVKVKDPYVREDGVINTNCTTDVRNVFLVQSGGDVEMYDMTVMGGGREKNYNVGQLKNYADQSSAVAVNNGGVLKMENVTLTRSNGGLVTERGSRVLIDKCQIVRNCRFCGGGMYTRGVVVMNDSSLSENRSTGYWDLSKNQWGGGGAAENQGEMYINNCVICNNVSGECGGAINNYSDTYDIKLYMINSTVAGNFTTKGEVNAGGISLRVGYTGGKSEFCAVNNIICNNYYYNTSAKTVTMSDIRVGAPKTSTDPVESFIAYNAIGDFKAGSYTNITTLSNITYVVPANEDVFLSYYSSTRTYQWDETTRCEINTGSLRSAPNDPNALYTPINPTGAAVVDSAGVTTYFDYSDWKSGFVKMAYAAADGELEEIGALEMATADDLVTSFYETDIVPDTITREIGIMGADGWTTDDVNYYKLRLIEEPVNGEVANITMYGRDYPAGTEVTVLATPDFACTFLGWYEVDGDGNDVLVSPDAAYTVVMDRHVGLKAKFSEPTEPHVFLNITCEQTEGTHTNFPITITTNWLAKAFPAICPDGLVTAANETDLEAALNARDAENGLNHVWQNYVLGGLLPGDPNGRIWIRADQTRDEETLRFRMQELAPTKGCGFKVRYRLNKKPAGKETYSRGSYAESGSFEDKVTLSDLEHRVIDLIFIPTNSQTSAEYVTTVNTAGVVKVDSPKKIEILAAPWSGFSPTNNPAVKASEFVKASCLTTNDVLYVYDQAESNYLAWAVQADGTWRTLRTFQIENGRVVSERGADATRTNAIPRGAGAWLERKDPSKPIYLYGQVDESSVTTPLAAGWNLIGSPAIANFDVTELPAPAPERQGENGDHVIVPTDAAPINLTYKDGSWGYTTNVVREIGGKTFIQPTRVRSDIVVPVGCGFWYIGAGEGAVEWWPQDAKSSP